MEKKICSNKNCHLSGIEQDISNFSFRKDRNKYQPKCKHCQNIYNKNILQKQINVQICNQIDCYLFNIEQDISNFKPRSLKCRSCANKKERETVNNIKNNSNIEIPKIQIQICSNKNCHLTDKEQDISNFSIRQNKTYEKRCKDCISKYHALYNENNKKELNKKAIIRRKKRKQNNPILKIRDNISRSINLAIRKRGFSKNKKSCKKYLPFTFEELKEHIEKQFLLSGNEWMNWNNQGMYIKSKWDDNDPTTWKWQLDHIIPHSTFNYINMECQKFKDCWALSNLRPLSAKQNLIDGATKIRHKVSK